MISADRKERTLVVVSSKTGNTMMLAHALADEYALGRVYRLSDVPEDLSNFDTVLLGFWCDKGDAPSEAYEFMQKVNGKTVGCFATMGADASTPHAQEWMKRTSASLADKGLKNRLVAAFVCRGRIDPKIFDHMTAMLGGVVTPEREANRRESETHPDRLDLLAVVEAMRPVAGD